MQGQPFQVIVDYAHTPDGFEKIMTYAQTIRGNGRVTAVFGAAGRRDTTKRPCWGGLLTNIVTGSY
jgi:UDP-N-acetylmuramoyl-L-alanyl-D-glutamate--2,6-diaminopimelate ligase